MTNAAYQNILISECGEPLVDLANYHFVLDPQYFHMGFTDSPKLYLREGVAQKLLTVQNKLKKYQFKIWDPWRPRDLQNRLYQNYWQSLQKQNPDWSEDKLHQQAGIFLTRADDPNRIPPHATGAAIDLTLVDHNGDELNMGTGFDHFGPEASCFYFDEIKPNKTISTNRRLLREAMLAEGFSLYPEEWWHFDYGNQLWAFYTNAGHAVYGEV